MQSRSVQRKAVLEVIARDKNTCQYCGKVGVFIDRYGKPAVVEDPENLTTEGENYNGPGVRAFEIHHLVPRVANGSNEPDNLKLACRGCNRSRGYLYYLRSLLNSGVRTKQTPE